jgi:TPR repeat protein
MMPLRAVLEQTKDDFIGTGEDGEKIILTVKDAKELILKVKDGCFQLKGGISFFKQETSNSSQSSHSTSNNKPICLLINDREVKCIAPEKVSKDKLTKEEQKKLVEFKADLNLKCNRQDMIACVGLGALEFFETNSDLGMYLFSKACDNKQPAGCNNLAATYFYTGNEELSHQAYLKACNMGEMLGCYNVGTNLMNRDKDQATDYLLKSCNGGVPLACSNLGVIALGNGKTDMALKLFKVACNGRAAEGCLNHGTTLKNMNRLSEGKEWFRQACFFGSQAGCDEIGGGLEKEFEAEEKKRKGR